jgi:hypothetical protein
MTQPSTDIPNVDNFTATALQTSFQLTGKCNSSRIFCFVNGVRYRLSVSFTLDNVTGVVTWLNAPFTLGAGDEVSFEYWD